MIEMEKQKMDINLICNKQKQPKQLQQQKKLTKIYKKKT